MTAPRKALFLIAAFFVVSAFVSNSLLDFGYAGRYGEQTAVITTVLSATFTITLLLHIAFEVTRNHPMVTHVTIGAVICLVLLFGTSAGTMMSAFVFSLF